MRMIQLPAGNVRFTVATLGGSTGADVFPFDLPFD
jgi:hypothetical protein